MAREVDAVIVSDDEALALLLTKRMLRHAATPVPEFLNWVADRLSMKFGDDPDIDFVVALRERARQLTEIADVLGVGRR